MSIDQVTAEAMALPPEERLTLADALYDSVPGQEDGEELDPEFLAEVRRRCEELDSGKVVGRSWEEVRATMMRKLGCD